MKEQKTAWIFIYSTTPHKTVTTSTIHSSKESALEAIELITRFAGVKVLSKPQKLTYTLEVEDAV